MLTNKNKNCTEHGKLIAKQMFMLDMIESIYNLPQFEFINIAISQHGEFTIWGSGDCSGAFDQKLIIIS